MVEKFLDILLYACLVAAVCVLLVVGWTNLFSSDSNSDVTKTELVASSKKSLVIKAYDFKNKHNQNDVTIGNYHKDSDGVWHVAVTCEPSHKDDIIIRLPVHIFD